MSSYPFVQTSSVFNTSDYNVLNEGLTIETANALYLSLNGGVISGSLNVAGNLDCTTLTVGGLSLNVDAITGVTEGICSASKALIVDSSRNINNINSLTSTTLTASSTLTLGATSISETEIGFLDGVSTAGTIYASKVITVNSSSQINSNLQLATSRKILMNNSSSSGAYIDMGATASDRCISLFSDAVSYYGFGANLSNLRSFSKDSFAWYTGATQSVIGTSIMTLNSAGLLTTTSITATSITGTLQTAAQPNITSVATLDITTHDGSSVGLKLGGVLVSATATELNYNTDVVAGTVLASSSVVVDSNKDITGFRRLSVGGTTGIMQINALTGGDAAIRLGSSESVNKCWTIQYLTATNLLRFDAFGSNSSITLNPAGDLTSKASFDTLAYKLNGVAITMSALTSITLGTAAASKALTLDASSNITGIVGLSATNLTGTLQTAAQPNITSIGTLTSLTATGALTLSGSIGISLTTDATSSTNGGTFTTAGGVAVAKKIFAGDSITSSGKLITTISGQGWSHNDGVNNLVSYVNNAGFGANCYFGSATASNLVLQTNNIGYITIDGTGSGLVSFTSSTDATSNSSGGCVQIAGGVGIMKKLYVGSNINASGSTASTSNTTGILTLAGGIGISNTTDASSITNGGTLTSAGGGAFAKSVYIGGNLAVTGTITLGGSLIDLGYITGVTAGTAVASKALVLDASKNISTINSVTSNYVVCNTAFNSPAATANLSTLNLNGIATNYGVASIKGNATLNSPSFATTNSVIYMESSNATPITAEFGLSSGTGATSTNGLKLGTLSNNDFSLFTNAGIRMVIKANASIGLGSNASTADKTLCLLDGIAGVTTTSFRIGNTLTTNNCMSLEWICSGGSGSGGNGLHFNPYGTSDALVINCNGYVGIGGNGLYPLDIFSYKTSTVVAPYALSESTTASYVASPNLSGQNISLNCLHSALFLEKVFISSDRRLKKNIAPINLKVARQFLNVQPVVYHKREQADNDMLNFGYIAQDIMKNSIGELLCHVDNDNMKIEEDGDIPGIQFNVQYDKVAPLLHVIVKEHDNIIEKLKSKINNLEEILKQILNSF